MSAAGSNWNSGPSNAFMLTKTKSQRCPLSAAGANWNSEVMCAGNDSRSLGIVMTEITTVRKAIEAPLVPIGEPTGIPCALPICIDEDRGLVAVNAGIPLRVLLDFLSASRWVAACLLVLPYSMPSTSPRPALDT